MGKKAKVESATAQAVPAPVHAEATPVASKASIVLAALGKMKEVGSGVAEPEKGKTSVPVVKVEDKTIQEAKKTYIEADAKRKAAESRMGGPGTILREWADAKWLDMVRTGKTFFRTLSLDGDINYGSGHIKMVKPDKKKHDSKGRTISDETLLIGLMEIFGAKYETYFEPSLVLIVAPEYSNTATIDMLKEKLGKEQFHRLFPATKIVTDLKRDGVDSDAEVLLKRDAALDPVVFEQVERAVKENYVSKTSGALTSQQQGLSAANETLLAEEKLIQKHRDSQVASAAAAGAAAGIAAQKAS